MEEKARRQEKLIQMDDDGGDGDVEKTIAVNDMYIDAI